MNYTIMHIDQQQHSDTRVKQVVQVYCQDTDLSQGALKYQTVNLIAADIGYHPSGYGVYGPKLEKVAEGIYEAIWLRSAELAY